MLTHFQRRIVVACSLFFAVLVYPAHSAYPASAAAGAELTGRVVSVADGDTLTILRDRNQIRIRLTEIDAPERGQAFGKRSTQSLRSMCAGRTARVVVAGQDRYQRTLGRVWCGGLDTSAEQVRGGMDGTPVQKPVSNGAIIGNRRSRVYHLPAGCPSYNRVSPKNRVSFRSELAARAAGYRIAGNCR